MVVVTDSVGSQLCKEGYVVVEDAIVGEELARLQAAFDRHSGEAKPAWLEGVARGHRSSAFFDVPQPLRKDGVFLDIVDHPSYTRRW